MTYRDEEAMRELKLRVLKLEAEVAVAHETNVALEEESRKKSARIAELERVLEKYADRAQTWGGDDIRDGLNEELERLRGV